MNLRKGIEKEKINLIREDHSLLSYFKTSAEEFIAKCYNKLNQFEKANKVLEDYKNFRTGSPIAIDTYMGLGWYSDAKSQIRTYLKFRPFRNRRKYDLEAYKHLVTIYEAFDEPEKATKVRKKVTELSRKYDRVV